MSHARDPSARAARAAARRHRLQGRLTTLAEADDAPAVPGTPEGRLMLLRELSQRAWALSGRPVPTYARHETPIFVRRLGDDD